MGSDITIFVLLAICTNTAFPVPFEPVLFFFLAQYPESMVLIVVTGSLCAAIGSITDLALAKWMRQRMVNRFEFRITEAGFRFYLIAFLFAFMPLPFSVIRVSLLKIRPIPVIYALAVLSGRFVRYSLYSTSILTYGFSYALFSLFLMFAIAAFAKRYVFANRHSLFGVLP